LVYGAVFGLAQQIGFHCCGCICRVNAPRICSPSPRSTSSTTSHLANWTRRMAGPLATDRLA